MSDHYPTTDFGNVTPNKGVILNPIQKPTPLTAASLANIELEIKAREGNGETRQDDPLFLRLLATIAELQREIEGYRRVLEKYGTHRSGCTWWKAYSNKPECSCGFERVLAGEEAKE